MDFRTGKRNINIYLFIYLLVQPLVVGHNGCYLLDWTLLYDNEEKAQNAVM